MIDITFLNVLMLISQVNLKTLLFVTIGVSDKGFKFKLFICLINSTAILNIHGVDYCCIIDGVTRSDAINL